MQTATQDPEETSWNIRETSAVVKSVSEDGKQMINEYTIIASIGEGQFGKVKLCHRKMGDDQPMREFAMKVLDKRKLRKIKEYRKDPITNGMKQWTALESVYAEMNIMRTLFHKNVVILFEVIDSADSDKVYFILEYMKKGPVMTYDPATKYFTSPLVHSFLDDEDSERLAKQHLRDIAAGIQYLHRLRICHRDIKPDNILLNENNRCHIGDFGSAHRFSLEENDGEGICYDSAGTFSFYSPECCRGEAFSGYQADVWAMGVTFFILLFRKLPFPQESPNDLFEAIQQDSIEERLEELSDASARPLSSECKDLLFRMLDKDPHQRITVDEVLDHPCLVGIDDENTAAE